MRSRRPPTAPGARAAHGHRRRRTRAAQRRAARAQQGPPRPGRRARLAAGTSRGAGSSSATGRSGARSRRASRRNGIRDRTIMAGRLDDRDAARLVRGRVGVRAPHPVRGQLDRHARSDGPPAGRRGDDGGRPAGQGAAGRHGLARAAGRRRRAGGGRRARRLSRVRSWLQWVAPGGRWSRRSSRGRAPPAACWRCFTNSWTRRGPRDRERTGRNRWTAG